MKKLVLMGAISILVLASCASAPEGEAYDMEPEKSSPASAASVTEAYIRVRDQPLINSTVLVSEIYYPGNSWITIHKAVEGKPGPDVGWTRLKPGLSTDARVALHDASGLEYFAMLHIDAGVTGVFEYPGPDIPVKLGEEVLMKKFAITR